jgi:hypothetical protein
MPLPVKVRFSPAVKKLWGFFSVKAGFLNDHIDFLTCIIQVFWQNNDLMQVNPDLEKVRFWERSEAKP